MSTVIFVPARYASSRYPGKPLVKIRGKSDGDKTLIHRSWEAAKAVDGVDAVYILTDDARIEAEALSFGGEVIMTTGAARNGTERCAEAVDKLGFDPDIIVNLQGDSPLTPAWFVEDLIQAMRRDTAIMVATPVLECDETTLDGFLADRKNGLVGGTTAVMNAHNDALYFSKEVLPYVAPDKPKDRQPRVYHHVGIYGYRPKALRTYLTAPEGELETAEGLEQLRFLEAGIPIKCVEVDGRGHEFWELNNPIDLARIENILKRR
ncbi:3-deoxy-manno-octulosonate cytidylyltransferase [Celeribacter sp.]|uniref:3-deoxy-manno-octulosonate cytidylyltransferase n=1 Tax=Celeribacter sp. TaxID=1890673 RepID=UPI003A93008D